MSDQINEYIPGTEHTLVDNEMNMRNPDGSELKKDGNIILIPQPTDSPNDPLNWSLFRKTWHTIIVCFICAFTAATTNDAGAAQNDMVEYQGLTWAAFNNGAGVVFIGIGYWSYLQSPSAFLYGRRIGYLICLLIGLGGAISFGYCYTDANAVWSQLPVGISESICEAQAQLSLMDIFFQHNSVYAMSLYMASTSIGTFLGPLIGGYVSQNLGDMWVGKMGAIISGFALIWIFFGLEETYFDRDKVLEGRVMLENPPSDTNADVDIAKSANIHENSKTGPIFSDSETSIQSQMISEPRKSYWTMIRPITPATNLIGVGFKQYVKRLVITLRVLAFPAVIYAGLQWGAQDAWLTFYMTCEEDNWADPPYNLGDYGVGNMNIPSLIGAMIGCAYSAFGSNYIVNYFTKRNHGIQEAEFRLWAILPTAIICPLGMFLFGVGTQHDWNWFPSYFGLVLIGFGWGCCGDLSMSYLVDCYPKMVLEGMVGVSLINNTVGMIFSFVCVAWNDAMDIQNVFISIGILEFFFIILTVPMMIWGKKCRKFTKKWYFNFVEARERKEFL